MIAVEELYALFKKCSGVSTDTRKVTEGTMFFALKGQNFDGNDFAIDALRAGAKYAVVDRVALEGTSFRGRKCILVENVLKAFQALANYNRRQYDVPVLAITGTNGKTTTKELIAAVLSTKYNVTATKANFNNSVGVPLTLLEMNEMTQMAVVEMGASAPGEIAELAAVAAPTCGLVTNAGKAHLLGFGSFEGVIATKGELYDNLRQSGGTVFFNADNKTLTEMVNHRQGLVLRKYGVQFNGAEIMDSSVENPFLTLKIKETTIATKLVGTYNADNVMAALCVADYFEVPFKKAVSAIEAYEPSNNRSQFIRTEKNVLIVDAYNANPTSMAASMANFKATPFSDKTLILGDMLELGESSLAEHKTILEQALAITNDICLVGAEFEAAARSLRVKRSVNCFATADELADALRSEPLSGKTILVKGSNGIHLQSLISLL